MSIDIEKRVEKLINNNSGVEYDVGIWYNRYTTDSLPITLADTPKYLEENDSNIDEDQRLINAYDSEIVDNRVNYALANPVMFEYIDSDNEESRDRNQELLNNWIKEDGFLLKLRNLTITAGAVGSGGLLIYNGKDSDENPMLKTRVVMPDKYILEWDDLKETITGALLYWSEDVIRNTDAVVTTGSTVETETIYKGEFYDGEKIYFLSGISENQLKKERDQPDPVPGVPFLELKNNEERKPSFYKVISLIDAYNRMLSDFGNEMTGFRHAILALYGYVMKNENDNDDDDMAPKRIKELRMLYLEEGSKAEYITKDIKYEDTEFILKQLEKNIERFTGHLNYADPEVYGKATNLAIKTRIKPLENKAKALIMHLDQTLQGLLKALGSYWNALSINDFDWKKVSIKFTLDTPLNDVEEAEKLVKLGAAGFSKKTIFSQASFINDPDAEIEQKNKELEEEVVDGDDFEQREPSENREDK